MGNGFRIGRISGIDIRVHPSWFVVFFVFVWALAASVFPAAYDWSRSTYWIVAVIATLLLFASVLVHELAHSLVARAEGIPVKGITLFLLGGVSTIASDASSPGREALMAGVGPLTSLVLGILGLTVGSLIPGPSTVRAVLLYLGGINVTLAVFNLLPGFPLDGGRVLRAILWSLWEDFDRATRAAARVGHFMGYGLILLGILIAFTTSPVGGVWMGFIGFVLLQASQATYVQSLTRQALSGVPVRSLMTDPRGWVPPDITLRRAANDYFLALNARCLPVEDEDGRLEGMVCLADLQRTQQQQWGVEQVQDVMTRREDLTTIAPDEPAVEAWRRLAGNGTQELAVMDGGRLLGFVDRAGVSRYLEQQRTAPRSERRDA